MARFGKYGTLVEDAAPGAKAPRFGKFGTLVNEEDEASSTLSIDDVAPRPLSLEEIDKTVREDRGGSAIDFARSGAAGAVKGIGSSVRGLGDFYQAAGRSLYRPFEMALRESGLDDVADAFNTPIPAWVDPGEIIKRPGQVIEGAGEKIAVPEERQTFATQTGEGLGQIAGQLTAAILTGGASSEVSMALLLGQGTAQMEDMRKQYAPNKQDAMTDAALIGGGAITALLEETGLENILERMPPNIRNGAVRQIADIAIAGGYEAAQEVAEGVLQRLTAMAAFSPDIKLFEETPDEAAVGGSVGAIARGLLNIAMPGRLRTPTENAAQSFMDNIENAQWDQDGASVAVRQMDPKRAQQILTKEELDAEIPNDLLIEGKVLTAQADADNAFESLLDEQGLGGIGSRVSVDFGDGRVEAGEILGGFDADSADLGVKGRGISIKLDNGNQIDELLETLQSIGVKITPEIQQQVEQAVGTAEQVQSGGGVLPAAAGQAAPGAVPSSPSGAANAPAEPQVFVPSMAQEGPTAPVQGLPAGGSQTAGAGATAPGAQNQAVGVASGERAAAAGIAGGNGTPTEGGLSGSTAAAGDDNAAGAKKVPSVYKERADELAQKLAAKMKAAGANENQDMSEFDPADQPGGDPPSSRQALAMRGADAVVQKAKRGEATEADFEAASEAMRAAFPGLANAFAAEDAGAAPTPKPLMRGDGQPYPTKEAAREAAKGKKFRKKNGRGWIPTKVEGGYGLKLRATVKGARKQGPRSAENTDILTFIASHGGIDSAEGDDVKDFKKMTQAGQLVRKGGRKWDGNDGIVRLLRDNEYFPGEKDPSVEEVKRVLADAIRHKKKIYRPDKQGEIEAENREAQDAAEEADARAAILAEADALGFTFSETDVNGILALMGERGLGVQAALDAWADEAGVDTAIELEQATGDEDYGDIPFEPIEAGGEAREGVEGQTRPGDAAAEGKTARGPPAQPGEPQLKRKHAAEDVAIAQQLAADYLAFVRGLQDGSWDNWDVDPRGDWEAFIETYRAEHGDGPADDLNRLGAEARKIDKQNDDDLDLDKLAEREKEAQKAEERRAEIRAEQKAAESTPTTLEEWVDHLAAKIRQDLDRVFTFKAYGGEERAKGWDISRSKDKPALIAKIQGRRKRLKASQMDAIAKQLGTVRLKKIRDAEKAAAPAPTFEEIDTVDGKRDQAVIAGAEKDAAGAQKAAETKEQALARLKGAQKKMRAGKAQEDPGGMFAPKQEDLLSAPPASDYGANNKLVSKDRADELARKLAAKFKGQLNTGIDPEMMAMGAELAIYHIEAGARRFVDFARKLRSQLEGLGVAWPQIKPYLRGWYNGARDMIEDKGGDITGMDEGDAVRAAMKDIDSASAASSGVESDSRDAASQDELGETDVPVQSSGTGSRPGSRGGAAGERGGDVAGGASVVPGAGAAPVGETGNRELRASKPAVPRGASERDGRDGGGADGEQGSRDDAARESAAKTSAPPAQGLEAAIAAQKAAMGEKIVPADKANIDKTLPFLREHQREDVLKAETRLYSPNGFGYLFTNGTGTGKTYVAGGLAARFWRSGERNILVVVPSQDMANVAASALRNHLQIPAGVLEDKSTNKTAGVVATTYANFQDNPTLADRTWDLVIFDESQKIMSSENSELTLAAKMMRANTNHPDGLYDRARMQLRKEWEPIEAAMALARLDRRDYTPDEEAAYRAMEAKTRALADKLKGEKRSRVVFLSATPFAYTFNVDYAQGYLFDWGSDRSGSGYNSGDNRDRFYMQHFGYRMRYNKLTKPDASVDTGVMERQFNQWLKDQGVLSGRRLEVPFDYDRKFVLVDDADGNPLVVYHGTPNGNFEAFDPKRIGSRDAGFYGKGIYLTPDRAEADTYAESVEEDTIGKTTPTTLSAYVSIKNPFMWDTSTEELEAETLARLRKMGLTRSTPENLVGGEVERFNAAVRAAGHDGIIVRRAVFNGDSYTPMIAEVVAFEPTQIKSTENNGNWDGTNPNIRESRASTNTPAFRQWFDGSAVVEADGSPRIMFHGTRAGDIREFRYTRNDLGMHFGTIEQANDRLDLKSKGKAEGNVIPVYLSIKNPLRLNDPGVWSLSNMYQELVMDPGAPLTDAEYHSLRSTPQLRAMLEAKGYDGIVYKNRHEAAGVAEVSREIRRLSRAAEAAKTRLENRWSGTISELLDAQKELPEVIAYEKAWPGLSERRGQLQAAGAADSYIAFRPEQIKSVFNQGTFDTGSRKISERRGMLPAQAKSIDAEAMAARLKEVGLSDKVIAKIRDWSKDPNAPNGRYLLRMIEISQQASNQAWVLNHEIVHALKDLGLISNVEWLKLKTLVMNNPALMADIKRRYPDLTLDEQIEEAISDTFAEWKREQGALSFLAKMWDRIQAFFRALRGDYQDAGEIFQAIDRGYIGRRDPVGEMSTEERLAAAYHGTPHDFDEFDLSKIGTGEGAQAYGWGLYFAGNRAIAEHYRRKLTSNDTFYFKGKKVEPGTWLSAHLGNIVAFTGNSARNPMTFEEAKADALESLSLRRPQLLERSQTHADPQARRAAAEDVKEIDQAREALADAVESDLEVRRGRLFTVDLQPAEDEYLLWDKPLSQQSEKVRAALAKLPNPPKFGTGAMIYEELVSANRQRDGYVSTREGQRVASEMLKAVGIRGNKYLDGASRNRPLKEIKRAFLDALPEDADGTELVGLLGSGTFDDKQEALIKALATEDWWGFDYPSQAISAALSSNASNWDPGAETQAAIDALKDDGTYNYVIFDAADVKVTAKESRGKPRIQGNLSQETAINKAIVEEKQGGIVAAVKEAYAAFRAQDKTEWLWASADEFAGLRALGQELNPGARDRELGSYVAARLSRHSAGQIEAFLKHGAPVWDAADQSLGISSSVPGLYKLVEPLFKSGKARLFEGYAYARRVSSQNLIADGREHNLTDIDVQELLQLGQQHPEFVDIFDKVQAFKKATLDAAEAMGLVNAQQRATWEQADHIPFYRAVEENDRKSPRAAKGLAGQSPQIRRLTGGDKRYVVVENATGRVVDRFEGRLKANKLRRKLGQNTHSVQEAGQPIIGVIENLAQNITHLINASMRNHAAVMAIDEALAAGWAKKVPLERARALVPIQAMIRALEGKNLTIGNKQGIGGIMAITAIQPPVHPGNGIIAIRRQGQVEYYEVDDKLVYSALAGLYRGAQHPIIRFFGAFKNMLTRGVTAMPDFMVRNMVRDTSAAWIQSEERGFNIFKEAGKTLRALVTRLDDPRVKAIMAAGGDTGWYQNAPEEVVSQLRKLERTDRIGWLTYANPLQLFKVLERLGRASEIANRIVQYDETLKATGSRRQAAFDAADLMDFQLKGGSDFMLAMTAVIPFLNARIQGLYKLGRYAMQKKSRKSLLAKAGIIMAFSTALALINAGDDDDDGYNDLPEYVKDSSWAIPIYRIFGKEIADQVGLPRFLLIPKPFELGTLFGTVPERIVQGIAGNDSRDATLEAVARAVLSTFAFNPAGNPITMEILQQWANKDVFRGEPIVGTYQQYLPAEDQYNAGTTQSAKGVGRIFGVSPARLEHAVRGFTGTAGMWFLEASDVVAEKFGITPPSASLRLDEAEILRSFASGSPVRNSKWVDEFYNLRDTAEGIAQSIRQRRQNRDTEGANELFEENRGLVVRGSRGGVAMAPGLDADADRLARITRQMKDIRQSEDMTPAQKREELDRLIARRNEIAKARVKKWLEQANR